MARIRFTSPVADLHLPGVPARFVNFVYDIDDTDTLRLSRMRWQGAPYGIREEGTIVPEEDNLTEEFVASAIESETSVIGQAVSQRLIPVNEDIDQLREEIIDLANNLGGASGVTVGNELPATLAAGAMAARLRTY